MMSINRRINFPTIGHFDTWMIDVLQILYEENHNVALFRDWSNSLDYVNTPESFGTVALHSDTLQELLENLQINSKNVKLTSEQQHVANAMGTKLPFLPIETVNEKKIFTVLYLENDLKLEKIPEQWMRHVDRKTILPKLMVHLRLHKDKWKKNTRIKDAIKRSENSLQCLQNLFDVTNENFHKTQNLDTIQDIDVAHMPNMPDAATNLLPNPNPPSCVPTAYPQQNTCQLVGGYMVGMPDSVSHSKKKTRGKDRKQRKKRECSWCCINNPASKFACPGRGGLKFCPKRNLSD